MHKFGLDAELLRKLAGPVAVGLGVLGASMFASHWSAPVLQTSLANSSSLDVLSYAFKILWAPVLVVCGALALLLLRRG